MKYRGQIIAKPNKMFSIKTYRILKLIPSKTKSNKNTNKISHPNFENIFKNSLMLYKTTFNFISLFELLSSTHKCNTLII